MTYPTKGRFIFPATETTEETIYNIRYEESDDPELLDIFLENGAFVGTIAKASIPPEPS